LVIVQIYQIYGSATEYTLYGNEKASYLQLEPLQLYTTPGAIKFRFKTTEPNGLLLYADDHERKDVTRGLGNYLRVELKDSQLFVEFKISANVGDENYSHKKSDLLIGNKLNDDNQHYVQLLIRQDRIAVYVDRSSSEIMTGKESLKLHSPVYVGGVPNREYEKAKIVHTNSIIGQK